MVWLLPEPDSPTMATVSPGATSRLMPFTACRMPSPVRKRTLRLRTERTGSAILAVLRIEGVAQAVADEVETEQGRDQENGGEDQHPSGVLNALGTLRDEHAPAGIRFLDAEAEEREEALEQDHLRHEERHVDDHGAEGVRDDVPAQDAAGFDAQRLGGLHVFLSLDGQGLAADDAGHIEPLDGAHCDEHQHEVA